MRLLDGVTGRGAGPGVLLAVEHVGAGDLLLAAAHQRQLDLVLDVLDVQGAAVGHAAQEGVLDRLGGLADEVADPGGGGGVVALHGDEGLAHGHGDLVGIEGHDVAVALDDAQGLGCGDGNGRLVRCDSGIHGAGSLTR